MNFLKINETEIKPLLQVINNLNVLHKQHSENWLAKMGSTYNLKKIQIRDVCGDNKVSEEKRNMEVNLDFIEYMNSYCDGLKHIFFNPFFDYLDEELEVTTRIKHPESRVAKLLQYMNVKSEKGKVNINKCLNDLLGFRVFVENFGHTDESFDLIREGLDMNNIRIHNSCKGEYRATHIYFNNQNNLYFPWELQIWNYKDDVSNKNSHSVHKQGYTEWASVYRNTVFEEVKIND